MSRSWGLLFIANMYLFLSSNAGGGLFTADPHVVITRDVRKLCTSASKLLAKSLRKDSSGCNE